MSSWCSMARAFALVWLLGSMADVAAAQPAGDAPPSDTADIADDGTGGAGGALDEGAAADGGAEDVDLPEPAGPASDARRLVRIRRVIALDKQRMTWLRGELRSRTEWFERLAEGMTELGKERNALRQKLEALEALDDADPNEVDALRTELEEITQDFELYDVQTDLALKAEKTVREQLEALETKIEKEQIAVGKLTGEIPIDLPEEEPSPTTAPTAQADADLPTTPVPIPGMPAVPAPAPAPAPTSSMMTAAQLEAENVLAERRRDVAIAKQELAEFVERKEALQRQIELERELAESDQKERENLERALAVLVKRLQTYRDRGAPKEKIERRERNNRGIREIIAEGERASAARSEYIESLLVRLAHLEEAQLGITQEVDEAEEAAEQARRRVQWLESPIHPRNVLHWAKERGPRMLLVIAAAFFLLLFVQLSARRIARAVVRRRRDDRGVGTGRADTLAFSFRSASRVLITLFAVLLVLQEAGVDIKTVLGGAAIIGVAIAFGAQDLMKDYFSGFLILLEDQYQLGDLVTIGGITGTVESVNMRVTVLRDLEGRVHFMPNGNIAHVTNRTYGWGRPVFEVPVAFEEDVDRVMDALIEVAKDLRDDPDWRGAIIGDPEMLGVDRFTEYGVLIKFMVKTRPDKLFPVRRQMLRRISKRFNELGIKITVPQRMIVRDGPQGDAL